LPRAVSVFLLAPFQLRPDQPCAVDGAASADIHADIHTHRRSSEKKKKRSTEFGCRALRPLRHPSERSGHAKPSLYLLDPARCFPYASASAHLCLALARRPVWLLYVAPFGEGTRMIQQDLRDFNPMHRNIGGFSKSHRTVAKAEEILVPLFPHSSILFRRDDTTMRPTPRKKQRAARAASRKNHLTRHTSGGEHAT